MDAISGVMMKAMILAAGRGERMKPITEHTPKPLIEVRGQPLIFYHLKKLVQSGVTDVVINISYLAEKIKSAIASQSFNLNIHYSFEPEALETAGGIINALPLLGEEPFIAINGDIFTDYPFEKLVTKKLSTPAHLVLVPNPEHNPKGDFALAGELLSLDGEPRFTYSGIAIYSPQLFSGLTQGRRRLTEIFYPAIEKQQISGEIYNGVWNDVGTVERYMRLLSS